MVHTGNFRSRSRTTVWLKCAFGVGLSLAAYGWWHQRATSEATVAAGAVEARQALAAARARCLATARKSALGRERLAQSRQRLEQFTRQRFDELRHTAETHLPADEQAAEGRDGGADARAANTELARLLARGTALRDQRSVLLERLTPQHPSVQDLDAQLLDVQRQADGLAAMVSIDSSASGQRQADVPGPGQRRPWHAEWQALVDAAAAGSREIEDECRQLEQELALAERERLQAERDCLDRADELAALGSPTPAWDAAAKPDRWSMSWPSLAGVGCIGASALAWIVERSIRRWRGRNRIARDADELEKWFQLPVLAALRSAEPVPRPAGAVHRGWLLRGATLGVHLAAAGIVFVLVAMTVRDPGWLSAAATQPLTAFSTGFAQLW